MTTRLKYAVILSFLMYGILIYFLVQKCVETHKNELKIEQMEYNYIQKASDDIFKYKDITKIDYDKTNMSKVKRAYFDILYMKK